MLLDFRIDWGYQFLYSRVSYHPEFIWDGRLDCKGGTIEKSFHLAYPYVVFGPGHSAVEEPLEAPEWKSRTQNTFDGMRFVADAPDDAAFTFKTASCSFEFTAGQLCREKRIVVPVGPKYLGCNVIVTLTGFYWFQPKAKPGQIVFNADDLHGAPVRQWARMQMAWLEPGKSVNFSAVLAKHDADFVERIMHLVIMAAPLEFTPGDERQVEGYFPIDVLCDGRCVAQTTRYLRAHDVRMQLLEDEWLRFNATPGLHAFEIVNRHQRCSLLINRIVLQDSVHNHLDFSVPEWTLANEEFIGRIFAVRNEHVVISCQSQTTELDAVCGWNEFRFMALESGKDVEIAAKGVSAESRALIPYIYNVKDEALEVTVGYDMTVVPHDGNGGMDWLLDYTERTRLGNLVVFRNFIGEETPEGITEVPDALLSRWGDFCRKHRIFVEAATSFDSGALVKASGEMLHSVGKHEATFAVYGRQPDAQWQSFDMRGAMEHFMSYMQAEIARAKKVSPRCAFGDPSGAHRYVYMAGADFIRSETMVPHTQHICSQARPAAEIFGNGEWGVHIAIQHAMQPFYENHLGIFYLSLMQPWAMGANMFYEEDSLFELFKEERQAWDDALTKGKRDMLRDFFRFAKTHPRKGEVIRKIAFVEGRYAAPFNGFPCNVQESPECSVWGMFGNESPCWRHLQPEKCRHILDVLMPGASVQPLRQKYDRRRMFFSGTPFGDFDEVPIEAGADYLERYSLLLHLGWNTMIAEDYDKLKDFVRKGGTLLIGLPQFSKHVRREYLAEMEELDLWNDGELTELCGINANGAGVLFSGKWKCANGFSLDENVELSSLPSKSDDEDAPCRIANIDIVEAETIVFDEANEMPLVVRKRYGKGCVYLLCTYAFFGHNRLQRLSAALVKRLAAENLPECYVIDESGEIFWNTRRIDDNAYVITLLNTDWTKKGGELHATICCKGGINADISVKERQIMTVVFQDGKLTIN